MDVITVITQLIDEKKKNRKIPHCATLEDVMQMCNLTEYELRDELSRLKKEGKIAFKQTINSSSIYLITTKQWNLSN